MRVLPLTILFSLCATLSGCVVVVPGSCTNGLRDGDESDVDCGGRCGTCGLGRACRSGSDCATGLCSAAKVCVSDTAPNTCGNGVKDGGEEGVDCGAVCSNTCAMGHPNGAGGSFPPSNTPYYRVQPGGSTIVQPGTQAGYGITANLGGSFRIVWTGDGGTSGVRREFYGSIFTAGQFSGLVRGCNGGACPIESSDLVSDPYAVAGGERIDFDALADSGLDGFDVAASNQPVYFDLLIDGQRYPELVFFPSTDQGGQVANSAVMPFGLTTQ